MMKNRLYNQQSLFEKTVKITGKVRTVKVVENGKVVDKVVKCPRCGSTIGDIVYGEIHVYFKCFICWELFDLGLRA